MLLHGNGVVCASFDAAVYVSRFRRIERGIGAEKGVHYVLSLPTIIHCAPITVPSPVTIPPAGTSSPGYISCPANADNSRKGVPGSIKAVMRLVFHSLWSELELDVLERFEVYLRTL